MRSPISFLRAGRRGVCVLVALLGAVLAAAAGGKKIAPPEGVPTKDEFSRLVQLAPFVVRGQQLAVSIHARNSRDRRYAQEFAEDVLRVIHESGVSEKTGKGLVIIGQKGEPHPIGFFRQFLALAEAGKLDPAVAARAPDLQAAIEHWQRRSESGSGRGTARIEKDGEDGEEEGVDLEFEKIATALPLPLEGIAAQLYQLAWFEKFDAAKVETKLRALRAADLERDLFTRYDWVFYLPPRNAFDRVLDEIIADALKEEDVGFVGRVAVKGALLVVKPKIRKAIEGMRHGLMFDCVVRARSGLDDDIVSELTGAYLEQFIPGEHKNDAPEHERAVRAVREEWQKLKGKAGEDV
ncbi:MAG: hypothetical protein C0518_11080 [Opitutus sp.]|nr:hypothetical protein [Opitutus sp.]